METATDVKRCSHFRKQSAISCDANMHVPFNPDTPLLTVYPKTWKWTSTRRLPERMSTTALCMKLARAPKSTATIVTYSDLGTRLSLRKKLSDFPQQRGSISETLCWEEETQRKECLVWVLFWEGCGVEIRAGWPWGSSYKKDFSSYGNSLHFWWGSSYTNICICQNSQAEYA